MSPSIFGFIYMDSVVLLIYIAGFSLYSSGSGVRIVHVVLCALRIRVFVLSMHTLLAYIIESLL